MSIDTEHFRDAAARGARARRSTRIDASPRGPSRLARRRGRGDRRDEPTTTSATTATATLDREIDYTLDENSEQVLSEIDAALQRIEDGHVRHVRGCGKEIAPERLEAHPVGVALHRRRAQGGARVSEPARRRRRSRRLLDRRAHAGLVRATRSLAAGAAQWAALARDRARGDRRRPADEARRREPARARRRRARRRAVLDPPRAELGHRVRALRERDRRRDRRSPAIAVAWMLVFFARSGARHPDPAGRARARDRRQRLEPRSTASGSATSPTSSTSATGRRSTSPTASS